MPATSRTTKQKTVGVERGLQQLMDDCAKKTSCAFHHDGNPMAAYDALMAKLAIDPMPSAGRPVRRSDPASPSTASCPAST